MIPIAVQLYSVRNEAAKDVPGTLAEVAKIGYTGVELAGMHGVAPAAWAKALADNGLQAISAHIGIPALFGDEFDKTVEAYSAIGCKRFVVPGLGKEYTATVDGYRLASSRINEIAERAKPLGISIGYHNHAFEFYPVENKIPMMVMLDCLMSSVEVQWDLGNLAPTGFIPTLCLRSTPGRLQTVHAKPYKKDDPSALIGDDSIPWAEVAKICKWKGKTEWFIVEYEYEGLPPMECIKKCHDNLKKFLVCDKCC